MDKILLLRIIIIIAFTAIFVVFLMNFVDNIS